jgi:hypothetical protein
MRRHREWISMCLFILESHDSICIAWLTNLKEKRLSARFYRYEGMPPRRKVIAVFTGDIDISIFGVRAFEAEGKAKWEETSDKKRFMPEMTT